MLWVQPQSKSVSDRIKKVFGDVTLVEVFKSKKLSDLTG